MKVDDLTGRTFELLTVSHRVFEKSTPEDTYAWWFCTCVCGGTKKTSSYRLKKGLTRSCGCLRKKRNRV